MDVFRSVVSGLALLAMLCAGSVGIIQKVFGVRYPADTLSTFLLLAFAAVSLCLFFSRRFISPIRRALAELKQSDPAARQPVRSNIPELDDLSVFLAQRDDELRRALDALAAQNKLTQDKMARVQSENERLLDAQRNVVSEDDFAHFCAGIKRLTAAEKRIFVLYLEGKNGPEITELLGIKQSTLKYHTGNMYTKLGVSSRKQLLNLAALYADRLTRQLDAGGLLCKTPHTAGKYKTAADTLVSAAFLPFLPGRAFFRCCQFCAVRFSIQMTSARETSAVWK